jgi:hypothetical protein
MHEEIGLYTSSPSETTDQWFVWDFYEPLPPKPVFFGTMEEAGAVADALNERLKDQGRSAAYPQR